jgi:hypothetical protein
MTTNQKVAGSSPAERAKEIPGKTWKTRENESPWWNRWGLLAAVGSDSSMAE